VRIEGVSFDAAVAARGAIVGVVFSLLAAWFPAREAGRVAPANTTRPGSLDARLARGGRRWLIAAGIAQLALAAWVATLPAVGGVPVWGFAAAFLVIFGFAALAPTVLRLVDRLLGPLYARAFGAEGVLAVSFVEGARSRTTVAVTGLMIGLAMVISVGIMVGSFRETVVQWLAQTVRADVLVKPASLGANANEALMPASLAERIGRVEGVADADLYRLWRIELNGRLTNYGAGQIGVFARHARLGFVGPPRDDRIAQLESADAVIVTETFAYRHGVAEGDLLTLPVEGGTAPFTVAGVYREYSSDLGYVMMDRSALRRHFPSMDTVNGVSLFLAPGADPDEVRARIVAQFGGEAILLVVTNREVRGAALEIFDQTFRVTHALILIAMVVSVLGVTNTLLAMIVDRRRELMTLRFVGMARWRVARVVMLESSLLSAAGIVLGAACGVALSLILIYVVNRQSFGWTIEFQPPIATLMIATILLYTVSLLAGLLPAREASRMNLRYR
jgi:putative ABC transport system permease protein